MRGRLVREQIFDFILEILYSKSNHQFSNFALLNYLLSITSTKKIHFDFIFLNLLHFFALLIYYKIALFFYKEMFSF